MVHSLSTRQILEHINEGYILTDTEGQILDVNPAYERMTGYSREELCTMNLHDLEGRLSPAEIKARIGQMTRQGWARFLSTHYRKDGVPIELEVSITVIPSEEGSPLVASFVRNITTEQRLAKELLEQQVQFRRLIERAPAGVAICRQGVVQYVNPAMVRLLRAPSPEPLLDTSLHAYVHPEDRSRFEGLFHGKVREGSTLRFISSTGEIRYARVAALPVLWSGEQAQQVMALDVTREQMMEREMARVERMEALGRLSGSIAHDFNNVLQVVQGYAELLLQSPLPGTPQERYARRILRASRQARTFVEQLMVFSRGRGEEPVKTFDLTQLVSDTLSLLDALLPDTLRVYVQMLPEEIPVQGQPQKLERALINLCINASQAMEEVEKAVLSILLKEPDANDIPEALSHVSVVQLTVQDTGKGIPPEWLSRIFEPYFSTKEPGKGAGLGLASVREALRDLGGDVVVESEPDVGTAFHLFIPRAEALMEEASEAEEEPPMENTGGGHILLVEDDYLVLLTLRDLLEAAGYQVTAVQHPAEALKVLQAQGASFDLVLTDYHMPGMKGLELSRKVTAHVPGLPVILMSGFTRELDFDRFQEVGIIDWISKPILSNELLSLVRRHLTRR